MVDGRNQSQGSSISDQNVFVGSVFQGRFKLSAKIGAGSFGTVFRATDRLNSGHRLVAKVQDHKHEHDVECAFLKGARDKFEAEVEE